MPSEARVKVTSRYGPERAGHGGVTHAHHRTGMRGPCVMQDFAAAFSKLLELGVPFPEGAPTS